MTARTTDEHPAIAWTAVLFAVGSACFLLAALASLWASAPRPAIGVTFFAGSLCFTSAAYLQHWLAVRNAPPWRRGSTWSPRHPSRWPSRHVDVLASLVQLVGTLLFNVNTFEAMQTDLSPLEQNLRVWTPDVFGSVCFLVSSQLAFSNVCRAWVARGPRTRDWWIGAWNLAGSVAFGVSAAASLIQPRTDEPVSAAIANATTAAGALCFLIGALLLYPPQRAARGRRRSSGTRRAPTTMG